MTWISCRFKNFIQFFRDDQLENRKRYLMILAAQIVGLLVGIYSAIVKRDILIENEIYCNYVLQILNFECGIFKYFLDNILAYVLMYLILSVSCLHKTLRILVYVATAFYTYKVARGFVIMMIFSGVSGVFTAILFYLVTYIVFISLFALASSLCMQSDSCIYNWRHRTTVVELLVLFGSTVVCVLLYSVVLFYLLRIFA